MSNTNLILILGSVATIVCGQIIFKYAATKLQIDPLQGYAATVRSNLFPIGLILLALVLYLISTLAWVQALRTVPLSIAFMFNSIAFILVPIASLVLFHEQTPRFFIPGVAMIVVGIVLISQ